MEKFYKQQELMEFLATKIGNQILIQNEMSFIINKSDDQFGLGLSLHSEEVMVHSGSYKLVYCIAKSLNYYKF